MNKLIDAQVVLDAAVKAATQYATLITDRDPDDGTHVVPGELRRFLGRLRLLHGVPFSYLVPDARLLPVETIRFFYIDRAWTDALVQGALSVGTISSADRTQLEAVYPQIRKEVDAAERGIRRPKKESRLTGTAGTITGFLLRSRAVSGWPNLHVRAYSEDVVGDNELTTVAESHPKRMKLLRMERLAPAVLLVLIDGVPEVVHIEEPRQGIQFGVSIDESESVAGLRRARVRFRDNLTGKYPTADHDVTLANSVEVPFRPDAPGVINMKVLRDRLAAKAPNTTAGNTSGLDPNEFALQMLRFPFRQVFGDPQDTEGKQFFEIDPFRITIPLPEWQQEIDSKVNPPNVTEGGGFVT